jgi:hypothetical protein
MTLPARTLVWYAGLAAALVVIASCNGNGGGGGTTGTSANAPVVTNFQIRPLTPEVTGRTVEWMVTATVTDPNNDVLGGRAEMRVTATGQTIGATIDNTFLNGNRLAIVFFINDPPPGRIDLVASVVDAAGNRSNEIPLFVTIAAAELRRGSGTGSMGGGWRRAR